MSFITNLFSSTPSEPTVPSTYTPASASGSSSTPAKPTKIPSDPSLVTEKNPEGLKPCCACPDTKSKRDQCFMNSDDGQVECKDLLEAHRACMLGYGFKV